MKHVRQLVGLAVLLAAQTRASAQGRPEARVDAIFSDKTAIYAGAGVLFPLGTYVRSGLIAAVGAADGGPSFRAEFVNLFHVDPFRESKWGPYAGGGLSFRRDADDPRGNVYLFALLGAEGPVRRGYAPSIELGLGGGVRAGVVLRRARERTR